MYCEATYNYNYSLVRMVAKSLLSKLVSIVHKAMSDRQVHVSLYHIGMRAWKQRLWTWPIRQLKSPCRTSRLLMLHLRSQTIVSLAEATLHWWASILLIYESASIEKQSNSCFGKIPTSTKETSDSAAVGGRRLTNPPFCANYSLISYLHIP